MSDIDIEPSALILCSDIYIEMESKRVHFTYLQLYCVVSLSRIQIGRRWKADVVTMKKHILDMRRVSSNKIVINSKIYCNIAMYCVTKFHCNMQY